MMAFRGFCFCCLIVVGLVCGAVEAQPIGKVTKIEDYGVQVNIGQQRSIMEGSRASIRALWRLIRKYPRLGFYQVNWRLKSKVPNRFESTYDRSHRSVSREVSTADLTEWDKFRYGLDEVRDRDIWVVARRGGSFSDIEERVVRRVHR